jgi:hypothetical protein
MAFTNSFAISSLGARKIEVDVITGGTKDGFITGFFIDGIPVNPTSNDWKKIAEAEETKFIVNQFNGTTNQPLKFLSEDELLDEYDKRISDGDNNASIDEDELSDDSGIIIGGELQKENRLGPGLRKFKTKKLTSALAYPKDIDKNQDYLQIDKYEYRPPQEGGGANLKNPTRGKKYGGTIILPMPKVSDSNAAVWGESYLNAFGLAAVGTVGALIPGGGGEGLDLGRMAQNTGGMAAIALAQQAAGFLSSKNINIDADQLLARTTGNIINPNAELLFSGVTLRKFGFSYKLVARSADEGANIRRIIKFFKDGMVPRIVAGNSLLGTPHIFALQYKTNNDNKSVNKFKDMALVEFKADYAPDGFWTAYEDSHPVAIQIHFGFSELQPIYDVDQLLYPADDVGY